MAEGKKATRLSKAAREFNVGTSTIIEYLSKKGYVIENNPNARISPEAYDILKKEYRGHKKVKEESQKIGLKYSHKGRQTVSLEDKKETKPVNEEEEPVNEDLFIKSVTGDLGSSLELSSEEEQSDVNPATDKKQTDSYVSTDDSKENIESDLKEENKPSTEDLISEVESDNNSEAKPDVTSSHKPLSDTKKEIKVNKDLEIKTDLINTSSDEVEIQDKKDLNETTNKELDKDQKISNNTDTVVDSESNPSDKQDDKKSVENKSIKENSERKNKPEASVKKDVIGSKKDDKSFENKDSRTISEGTVDFKSELGREKKEIIKTINEDKDSGRKSKNVKSSNKQEHNIEMKKSQPADVNKPEQHHKLKKEKPLNKEGQKVEVKDSKGYPDNFLPTEVEKLSGPKILDKIDLSGFQKKSEKKPVASSKDDVNTRKKKKRKRIPNKTNKPGEGNANKPNAPKLDSKNKDPKKQTGGTNGVGNPIKGRPNLNARSNDPRNRFGKKRGGRKEIVKAEVTKEDIDKQIKETMARLNSQGKSKGAKHRRQKRDAVYQKSQEEMAKQIAEKNVVKVTEFVTANELANMMEVKVNDIISTCMSLGLFVSINQRLDAETISLLAEEFGYKVEFVAVDVQEAIEEIDQDSDVEDNTFRHPVVTVMGHVDHGKTLLLDYVRKANVVDGEAGGITQHIGAYEVNLDDGRKITFLDTPGHEAFTAMRARGAKVTDVAIIIIAADDSVMPQTKEAINHAQAAGVPIVIALNKVDKPTANPEKIRQELAEMNVLVEDWGGKYQCQEISAKTGVGIPELLEKVILESELLELKANPDRKAKGTVIESSLDKGRGYITKILVQNGTLSIGDIVLAGSYYGRVKAMYNERNQKLDQAGPSTPLLLLGLNGAPQAGDTFNVMVEEKEAKTIATKRLQLQREQGMRTQRHITLDEIGRRIAIGDFKELNIIVKADVDGSVEALSDSLLKLTTKEVQVNVIHKSVGAVTESDVLLASASNAIVVGFQVRPTVQARKLAEHEQIDIRLYSIIYQAIEEIKSAIEGMLSPEIEEKIICNLEIREVFKISKVGTVAGCMILDGKIHRNTKVRLIRDGIVVYTGLLGSLKRFKEDVREVQSGYECGLNIENFNDIKVGDILEGYEEVEKARKL
ncbi:MAG: translation initiation factor IF-2 [Hyphomicrobiales bacterium]